MEVRGIRGTFHVGSRIEYDRVTTMIGEREVLESFVDEIEPDDVVWDVGSNVGTYAVIAGLAAETGAVVAFEPHPENARRIEENAALNDLENVYVERFALGDENGTAELHTHGDERGGGEHSLVEEGDGTVDVELRRGNSYVSEGGRNPNVVKIDVEGAELSVIDGMAETLTTEGCRAVFVEVHHNHGVTVEAAEKRFRATGFETTPIEERGGTTFLKATKTASTD